VVGAGSLGLPFLLSVRGFKAHSIARSVLRVDRFVSNPRCCSGLEVALSIQRNRVLLARDVLLEFSRVRKRPTSQKGVRNMSAIQTGRKGKTLWQR